MAFRLVASAQLIDLLAAHKGLRGANARRKWARGALPLSRSPRSIFGKAMIAVVETLGFRGEILRTFQEHCSVTR